MSSPKGARFSFIGPEMTITGNIATEGDLHVDGKIAGDIGCGTLTLGESGEVRGNIVAREARLGGLVDGAVEAGIVTLDQSARITGDILYETLSISGGADVEGRFKRRRGAGDGSFGARTEAARPALAGPASASLFVEGPAAEAAE
ncbi:MAG TPA: polymer-forming cytoskeletal protein [Allosphingosinicella sp.]